MIPPQTIVEMAKMIDEIESSSITNVFLPDTADGFDSIEIACASLGASKRLRIGPGIVRPLEHDDSLQRRIETAQSLSGNRFVLGVGTGRPSDKPSETINALIQRLSRIKSNFKKLSTGNLKIPETYVATLREGIAKKVAAHCSGLLLNFCSPEHAGKVIKAATSKVGQIDFACYLKVFYSRNKQIADRLLIEEFRKYDSLKQYHEMFQADGIADAIKEVSKSLSNNTEEIVVPAILQRTSLSSPSFNDLMDYVAKFREAGVTLPCIYPYFAPDEDPSYERDVIRKMAELL